jgi:hypothetical protein
MCNRGPDGHSLGIFCIYLAVGRMSNFVAQFVSYHERERSGPVQTYIHQRAMRNSALLINYKQIKCH